MQIILGNDKDWKVKKNSLFSLKRESGKVGDKEKLLKKRNSFKNCCTCNSPILNEGAPDSR